MGQDGEKRVRCEISQEALDDHFGGDGKDKVEVFMANRREIEELARRKYLAEKTLRCANKEFVLTTFPMPGAEPITDHRIWRQKLSLKEIVMKLLT